jgi:spore coat polysaccharide biosynthesis predicted glycosyltransferase SpsG
MGIVRTSREMGHVYREIPLAIATGKTGEKIIFKIGRNAADSYANTKSS